MIRKSILAVMLAVSGVSAHAALSTGDMAFTSFNADEDGWSMVTFVDIAANTKVYFTDNEWTGSAFNTGESYHQWDSGSTVISAGSVIRFSNIDTTSLSSSKGTLTRATVAQSTNYGISQTADTIYAYVGSTVTAAPTSFLSVISSGILGTADAGNLTNTELSIGAGAVQLSSGSDYAEYNGTRVGLNAFSAYKPLVSDVSKWNDRGDGSFAAVVPNTTAFSIAVVPEPQTYAMLLAGLGLMGLIASRRSVR